MGAASGIATPGSTQAWPGVRFACAWVKICMQCARSMVTEWQVSSFKCPGCDLACYGLWLCQWEQLSENQGKVERKAYRQKAFVILL